MKTLAIKHYLVIGIVITSTAVITAFVGLMTMLVIGCSIVGIVKFVEGYKEGPTNNVMINTTTARHKVSTISLPSIKASRVVGYVVLAVSTFIALAALIGLEGYTVISLPAGVVALLAGNYLFSD